MRENVHGIKIIGYCDLNSHRISELIRGGRQNEIINAGGEFTVIHTNDCEIQIITSWIGAMHYFYYYDGNRFEHGEHIIEILRKLGLPWEWDWDSLGDLCAQENLSENRTLHKSIKRVPPGSILKYGHTLQIHSSSFLDLIKDQRTDAVDAVNVFNKETSKWISRNPYLSLSGGFDSRVILSSMLHQNIYPVLVTLGSEESTDTQVASSISTTFGLEHRKVILELDDFLADAEHIAFITNGSKPACHWHTFMYPKKAEVPKDESFYVGTLGEFARCYYFDKGLLSLCLDGVNIDVQERFWQLKLQRHQTFKEDELKDLARPFKEQLDQRGIHKRSKRNAKLSKGSFLAGGSRYYLEQRVPNFYSNGIRMYNETGAWRSPFHNVEWLRLISGLTDNWKLGSNWHRLAIKRNYPVLLRFPEEKGFMLDRMTTKAPPLYWLAFMQRKKYATYDLSQTWYCDDRIRSLIMDNTRLLDDVVNRRLCDKAINEHRSFGNRTKTISFLLTLLYFKLALRRYQER